ncbi:MAG: hypothetical protein M3463_07080 [Verrucomicrobiota bacterium]|nr:hypothetical protein [Verrucomicrobiota bacterium]
MKPSTFLLAVAAAFSVPVVAAESVVPDPFLPSRYEKLAAESPFKLATPEQKPPEPVQSWAAGLAIIGLVRESNDTDGKEVPKVWISGPNMTLFSLEGNKPGPNGISIDRVQSSDNLKELKVVLKKGSEFATLEFDKGQLNTPPPPVAPTQTRPPVPSAQPNKPGTYRTPTPTVPRPAVGAYPSTGAANPAFRGTTGASTPPSSSTRRRILPVPAAPQ